MDEQNSESTPNIKNTGMIAAGVSVGLILLIILQHNLAFQKQGTIVLPAGGTYLGPTNTPTPMPQAVAVTSTPTAKSTPKAGSESYTTSDGKFAVGKDAVWVTVKGNKYPYSFSAPKTLSLVPLSQDQYDIYAIAFNNQPPDNNVLVGVDDLRRTEALKKYITISKRTYVEEWWKQFGGLKGVASIVEFTNSKGTKGYRAKYINSANQTPNEDVFFETPEPHFVIHIASGVLDAAVFDQMIDSIAWNK
jgi:hypothetical protein